MTLTRSLISAVQLASSVLAAASGLNPSPPCKAVPGSPDWPSPEVWSRLNESLGGRLLQPTPPAAVCHPGHGGAFNSSACAAVRSGWSTYEFHQADPVSVDWNNFANETCLPIEGVPCSGQGYPTFVINATEARHVQLGVQFAKKHNISVTIESTAVTVGAGTQMWDLYQALDTLNQTVVGGGGKTVSLGGYVTGAGHGLLSSTHGLGADQVLEVELVTPKGDIVTANECQNEDLFWAVRGGGGSTFGVLTSVTMKTFATPKIDCTTVVLVTTDTTDTRPFFDMSAYVLSQFPSLGDQGLSGYSFTFPNLPAPIFASYPGAEQVSPPPTQTPDSPNATIGAFVFTGVLQNSSPEALRALWDPLFAHINATWPGRFMAVYQPASYPSFFAFFTENYDTTTAGANSMAGSRLLDRRALTADAAALSAALERFADGDAAGAYLVSGRGVHNAKPRGRGCGGGNGNAVLPGWRTAYVHATFGVSWPPLDEAAKADAQAPAH